MSEPLSTESKALALEDYRDQCGPVGVGSHIFINGVAFVISKIERNCVAFVNILDGSLKMGQIIEVDDIDELTNGDIEAFLIDSTEEPFMVLVSTDNQSIVDYIKLTQRIDGGSGEDQVNAMTTIVSESEKVLQGIAKSYGPVR